jgi:hypothetical protein
MKKIVTTTLVVAALLIGSSSVSAQPGSKSNAFSTYSTLNGLSAESPTLAQQPAPWCYTNVGRFPMLVALPAGVSCTVQVNFYPWVLYGTTGF